jgi:hypothetical protein
LLIFQIKKRSTKINSHHSVDDIFVKNNDFRKFIKNRFKNNKNIAKVSLLKSNSIPKSPDSSIKLTRKSPRKQRLLMPVMRVDNDSIEDSSTYENVHITIL